jgi:hypothetical protein
VSGRVTPIRRAGEVFAFPDRGHSPLLTKRQLANHLGRSTRWVELMVRDENMPAEWDRHRRERRYDLRAVEAWLQERVA